MIENPSFEEPALEHPGLASNWIKASLGALEETAEFEGDTGLAYTGYETFEHGFGDNDPQAVISSMETALEDRFKEPFDRWIAGLEQLLAATEAAVFQLTAVERFESAWKLTPAAGFDFVLGATASVPIEDFSAWGTISTTLSSTEAAEFGAAGLSTSPATPAGFERFELRVPQNVWVELEDDILHYFADPPPYLFEGGDAVTFTNVGGELPEPLVIDTTYHVASVFTGGFDLAAGGQHVDISNAGTGAHYVNADAGRYWTEEL